ncbi:MAG: hypothetical protein ABI919_14380, partial [Ramlibacter sp.]
ADQAGPAPGQAFPGSMVFAAEFVPGPGALPAWPILRAGFLGQPDGEQGLDRRLGIGMPAGPRGGPVYDRWGRWMGMGVRSGRYDLLIPAARLGGDAMSRNAAAAAQQVVSADEIYERAMRQTLQLIAAG